MERIPYWRTALFDEEIQKITECIKNEHLSQGPITKQFEEEFAKALNVPYVIATTSGSVALLMTLMAFGVGPGDEVIVPNITFMATAHAALMLGVKVVLVDTLPELPVMDPAEVRKKITSKTKVIMPVHIIGLSVDMTEINKIAKEHGLFVVEDACQAMFSQNVAGYLGTQSDAGCFSLGVMKLFTTAQGGIIAIRDQRLYEKLRLIRNHGVEATFEDATYSQLGFNFKFTDIQAGIGLEQLKRVPKRIEYVRSIYLKYKEGLKNHKRLKLLNMKDCEVPLYVTVGCDNRPEIREIIEENNIQTRYAYPTLNISPHLNCSGNYPNSKALSENLLYLPCGPTQPIENVARVIKVLQKYL